MSDVLKTEIETFEKSKEELLGKAAGRFVLIKGNQIVDTFESQADALAAGYKQFGNVPFLVRQIEEIERPLNFTNSLIAV